MGQEHRDSSGDAPFPNRHVRGHPTTATSLTGRLGRHRQTRALSCAPCGTQTPVRAGELLARAEEPVRAVCSEIDPHKRGSAASGLEGLVRTTLRCMASRFVLSQHRDLRSTFQFAGNCARPPFRPVPDPRGRGEYPKGCGSSQPPLLCPRSCALGCPPKHEPVPSHSR